MKNTELDSVAGRAVDVKIISSDPLTVSLALRPDEMWWINNAQRRFGPVCEVVARFIVATGLRRFGYSLDRAIMNEIFPEAPLIPTTHHGLHPDNGRKFDQANPVRGILMKGGPVAGLARWWERGEANSDVHTTLKRRSTCPDVAVHVRSPCMKDQSEAGIAMAATDSNNYYAIMLQTTSGRASTRRGTDGVATVLGQMTTKLAAKPWHTIRVQWINLLSLDKGHRAVHVDGAQVAVVEGTILPQESRVGLIAISAGEALFDSLPARPYVEPDALWTSSLLRKGRNHEAPAGA